MIDDNGIKLTRLNSENKRLEIHVASYSTIKNGFADADMK